jgi:hypothetical protein
MSKSAVPAAMSCMPAGCGADGVEVWAKAATASNVSVASRVVRTNICILLNEKMPPGNDCLPRLTQ